MEGLSTESMDGGAGGLSRILGIIFVFRDKQAPAFDSAVICAQVVAETIDTDNVYLKPQIRDFLEKYRIND